MRTLLFASLAAGLVLGPASGVRAEDEARAIIDKAIKAHGGQKKLDKFSAVQTKSKGKIELFGGIDFTQEVSAQFPNKFKEALEMDIQGQKVAVTSVYNGKEGWINANGMDVELNDKFKDVLREGAYLINLSQLTPLRDKKYTLSLLGEVQVNGKPAVGIKVESKGHKDASFYFDKKTGLLVKIEHRTVDFQSMQEVTEERIITEYRDIDGRKAPKKVTVNRDGKKLLDAEVTEVKYLEKLDDSEFAKP
jgi:hypothetical protein